jgi:ABC-2 type transport system ATP-binding protein
MTIRTNDLRKSFGRTPVLDGVSLNVKDGSVFGRVGPNGAGKTTCIKILMNLIPADSGTAEILGFNSRRIGVPALRQIGYVSENQELPRWMTIDYFLRYLKPFYPSWEDGLAEELLNQFALPRTRKIRDLSRGMHMKVALVAALAYRPKVLILDEPFSGLDALVRDEFIGGLLERAEGMTIFISSHDLAEIESFASHIGYLDNGRLQFSEEIQDLSNRFREVEVTLEAPPPLPARWPNHWMAPETGSAVVRFVETRFDAQRSEAEIRDMFPGARRVDLRPMSLRSIFVTMAKSGRRLAA